MTGMWELVIPLEERGGGKVSSFKFQEFIRHLANHIISFSSYSFPFFLNIKMYKKNRDKNVYPFIHHTYNFFTITIIHIILENL